MSTPPPFPSIHQPKKRSRLTAVVIGIVLSVGLIYLGFNVFEGVITRADDEAPRDVVVNQVTETTAGVSWSTGVAVTGGVVQYGTSATSLTSFAPADTEKSTDHSITLSLLSPSTTYYFVITYGENKVFDNGGVPWVFTTKAEGTDAAAEEPAESADPAAAGSAISPTSAAQPASRCDETDCDAIKSKLGKGCETRDYILCIRKESQ